MTEFQAMIGVSILAGAVIGLVALAYNFGRVKERHAINEEHEAEIDDLKLITCMRDRKCRFTLDESIEEHKLDVAMRYLWEQVDGGQQAMSPELIEKLMNAKEMQGNVLCDCPKPPCDTCTKDKDTCEVNNFPTIITCSLHDFDGTGSDIEEVIAKQDAVTEENEKDKEVVSLCDTCHFKNSCSESGDTDECSAFTITPPIRYCKVCSAVCDFRSDEDVPVENCFSFISTVDVITEENKKAVKVTDADRMKAEEYVKKYPPEPEIR